MIPDEQDISILRYVEKNPRCSQREAYFPLLGQRSQSFLQKKVGCLIACGYLESTPATNRLETRITRKGKNFLKKLGAGQ